MEMLWLSRNMMGKIPAEVGLCELTARVREGALRQVGGLAWDELLLPTVPLVQVPGGPWQFRRCVPVGRGSEGRGGSRCAPGERAPGLVVLILSISHFNTLISFLFLSLV